MSQYQPTPKDPKHTVLVGWDRPLNTFFIHVIDTTLDEDDAARDVCWVGCTPGELHDLDKVFKTLVPYITASPAELSTLRWHLLRDSD